MSKIYLITTHDTFYKRDYYYQQWLHTIKLKWAGHKVAIGSYNPHIKGAFIKKLNSLRAKL